MIANKRHDCVEIFKVILEQKKDFVKRHEQLHVTDLKVWHFLEKKKMGNAEKTGYAIWKDCDDEAKKVVANTRKAYDTFNSNEVNHKGLGWGPHR